MEVVALKVYDVASKRMMVRVEQGKGRKDRHAMLSPKLLELLRDGWCSARPFRAPAQSRLPYGCRAGWAAHVGCAA
jgi:integrase